MNTEEFQFTTSKRGSNILLYDGYQYNLNRKNKGGSTNWRSVNRSLCSASITLNAAKERIVYKFEHTCLLKDNKNEILVAIEKCKKDVCEDFSPIKNTYEKNFSDLKTRRGNIIDNLPSLKNIQDSLYRSRKKYLITNKLNFVNLADVVVPIAFSERFLICNDGYSEKILIFSSKIARRIIRSTRHPAGDYFGDGTFKVTPPPFYQFYTIHLDLGSNYNTTNVVPVVYA